MDLRTPRSHELRSIRRAAFPCQSDDALRIIPWAGAVLFPGNVAPLPFAKDSLSAGEIARLESGKLRLGIVPQEAEGKALEPLGTEAVLEGILRLPGGKISALVRGGRRFRVHRVFAKGASRRLHAVVDYLEDAPLPARVSRPLAQQRSFREVLALAQKFLTTTPEISAETRAGIEGDHAPRSIAFVLAPHLGLTLSERVDLLGDFDFRSRLRKIRRLLAREFEIRRLTDRIHDEVQGDMVEEQRRAYLRDQVRAIKRELGEMDDNDIDLDALEERLAAARLPQPAHDACRRELQRMTLTGQGSPEFLVAFSYLSLMFELPWHSTPPPAVRLRHAREILDREHYGIARVKERILEYLAVLQHRGGSPRGQILLLAGPPGIGKTSLGRSIAEAMQRPFVRLSMGGVRDEAEIRGHRRTYIGSMPGKILQAMRQAKSKHPVILVDELDKVGASGANSHSGDVASALLEVLDPEQNRTFVDHYLAVPFDLSQVTFLATANNIEAIPEALLDRFDIVEIPGYTDQEKMHIARNHILPALRRDLKLSQRRLHVPDATILQLIRDYTREAGVRQLRRDLETVGRKIVRATVETPRRRVSSVSTKHLLQWLGAPRFIEDSTDETARPGVAIGLAYTSVGGDLLFVEATRAPTRDGKFQLTLTGSLGQVMRESVQTAMTFIQTSLRSRVCTDAEVLEGSHFHVHFPDGGTPKDGPSAGTAVLCALVSLLTGRSIPSDMAMTGEITLRGLVLPVGGIREKLLAAHRHGRRRVLIPAANAKDLLDVPRDLLDALTILPVRTMEEVLSRTGQVSSEESLAAQGPKVLPTTTSIIH